MTTTALLYLRVSTGKQEQGASLETQEQAAREKAAAEGWEIGEVFREVYTGEELWDRPALSQLRERVRAGGIDIVLCHALDRLSRKQAHVFILLDECARFGARLAFTTETFEESAVGQFVMNAKAFVAQVEREKIRERTQRGIRTRVDRGAIPSGRVPFGYEARSLTTGNHTYSNAVLVAGEHADVVRRIFCDAISGMTVRAIAMALTAEGVPNARSATHWHHSSVGYILRNRVYTGTAHAFTTYQAASMRGRTLGEHKHAKTSKRRPVSEWQALPDGTVEAIVDERTFIRVQQQLATNKATATRNNQHAQASLLRGGYARCGYCGSTMYQAARTSKDRAPRYYYRCSKAGAVQSCKAGSIDAAILDAEVWRRIVALLSDPDVIEHELDRRSQASSARADLESLDATLSELTARRDRATRRALAIEDDDAAAVFLVEVKDLSKRITQLNDERGQLTERLVTDDTWRRSAATFKAWCVEVRAELDDISYEDRRLAIDSLGVRATIYQKTHTPRFTIEAAIPLEQVSLLTKDSWTSSQNTLRFFLAA